MDVRPLVFRLDDYDKTLVLARATELVAHRSRATFSLEAEVRTRLMRRIGDDSCMRSLRQWMTARHGAEYGLHSTTNHELINSVLAAVRFGQVVATLTPAVHSTLREQPSTAIDERTRRLVESATAPAPLAPKIAASGSVVAAQSPAAPAPPSVAKMTRQEKIEELLKLTISKLPDAIRPQFVAMVGMIGVIKIAEIFLAWAASQFVGVGEVVDLLLGVALAMGVVFTGWSFYTGTKQLLEAVNGALVAQTDANFDSAASEMAEAVTTLGVAVLTLAMMGGAKGASADAEAAPAATAGDSAAAREAAAQRAAAERAAAEKAEAAGTEAAPATELHRPYIRQSVRAEVEARAPRTADGRPIDPNTGQPIDGTPDFGHKPGNEFWREKQAAEAEGLTQEQFNDRMNDPDKYQLEDPSSNRSHRYEQP